MEEQSFAPRSIMERRTFLVSGAVLAQTLAAEAGTPQRDTCKEADAPDVRREKSDVMKMRDDGLCSPQAALMARQLPALACVHGGVECPLIKGSRARALLKRMKGDPSLAIRLESDADAVPHYSTLSPASYGRQAPEEVFNRKRDLDVLQRLGLCPGDTRRARYLVERLFARIETMNGICCHDTPGWEGCAAARNGTYERVRAAGWQELVYHRSTEETCAYRQRNTARIASDDRLSMRPHHLMCLACGYAGGANDAPRSNDTLYEILQRMRKEPNVPVTLAEGPCEACDCCDGFHPETGRCVHGGGLIRDYKKDLDCFQKLGLMPGATLPANELYRLLFERIPSTREVCGYGDGVTVCEEWRICGDPGGNPGYEASRRAGMP